MKNKKFVDAIPMSGLVLFPVVYDDEVELAVSIGALPNVFPPSLLTIIIGWSFPSALSHQDIETLSLDASISARVDCIPVELLKLISSPNLMMQIDCMNL
jgi:hypothetical protein